MAIVNMVRLLRAMAGAGGIETFRDAAEQEVMRLGQLIPASPHAVERLNTSPPGGGVNTMVRTMPLKTKMRLAPVLLRTMNAVTRCADYMKDKFVPTRSNADAAVWEAIRAVAKKNGAVEVGFAHISEDDIFQGYSIPYRNAIVYTVDMDKTVINTAPSYDALIEVLSTYASLGKVASTLTDYLRNRGYGAYPGFPIGGLVDYVRVAQKANLGAIGYHGMLISPGDGTRQRINVVFTNMEMPQPEPNPHMWILDFCAKCQKCVRSCPPKAIYTTAKANPTTGRKPTVYYKKCLDYYANNQGCAVCVKVCPFSQAGYEKIQRGFLKIQDRATV